MKQFKVDILLGVYLRENIPEGLKYLSLQLDSLLNQSYSDFRILIRDDGSRSEVIEFLVGYRDTYPRLINLVFDQKGNLGYTQNYGYLMALSTADYFFLCDQDDIWQPEKISICISALQIQEKKYPKGYPILLCHDASIIDSQGTVIYDSFARFLNKKIPSLSLGSAISHTVSGGYAICGNSSLSKKSLPIFAEASAHDYHLCVVAKALGCLVYLDEKLVFYRVHKGGVSGSLYRGRRFSWSYLLNAFLKIVYLKSIIKNTRIHIDLRYRYANKFLDFHKEDKNFSEESRFVISRFCELRRLGVFDRLKLVKKYGYWSSAQDRILVKILALFLG